MCKHMYVCKMSYGKNIGRKTKTEKGIRNVESRSGRLGDGEIVCMWCQEDALKWCQLNKDLGKTRNKLADSWAILSRGTKNRSITDILEEQHEGKCA